jgi:cellulose synthase/poly-beta-1,6-N-acetylglucosamine synthase-like glycosyltransferase
MEAARCVRRPSSVVRRPSSGNRQQASIIMADPPAISVIIPTHNRSGLLRRLLDALGRQHRYPISRIEVLVVADGCIDDTHDVLRAYQAPYALRWFSQAAQGVAVARNRGAAAAQAPLLLFIDDDVVPGPATIATHVAAHQAIAHLVAIGPYPVAVHPGHNLLLQEIRLWWNDFFQAMRRPGYRYSYRDLVTGNCSIRKTDFAHLGGFDPAFWRHQDWELGLRAIRAGLTIRCIPEAIAAHHVQTDLAGVCRHSRTEGRMDVFLALRYPALIAQLPLASYATIDPPAGRLRRPLRILAFRRPELGDRIADRLTGAVHVAEALKLRNPWRRWMNDLRDYWYWRGVAAEIGSLRALTELVNSRPTAPDPADRILHVDLRRGLQAAAALIDRERPAGATIAYGDRLIGAIPPAPGAEPLRRVHLGPFLAQNLSYELLTALADAHAAGNPPGLPDNVAAALREVLR